MLKQIGTQAKDAAAEIAVLSTDKKNQILQTMADELLKNSKKILDANVTQPQWLPQECLCLLEYPPYYNTQK